MSSIYQKLIKELEDSLRYPNIYNFVENKDAILSYPENFAKRLQFYGCTERGGELLLNPVLIEASKLISNLSIPHLAITGNARGSKTLLSTLFMLDAPLFTGCDTLTVYPTEALRDKVTPTYTRPLRQKYWKNLGYEKKPEFENSNYSAANGRYLYYSYAKGSGKGSADLAEVPSALTAIGADILLVDEASQIPDPSIAFRRVEKSRLPHPIIREIGTPGGGGGIERRMNNASIYFYPHYTCPHCGNEDTLSPLTCLITELDVGDRPTKWFYEGSRMSVQNAVFRCRNCENILSEHTRQNAYLKCTKSGMTMTDLNDVDLSCHDVISLHFSPLMKVQNNLARRLIHQASAGSNIADYWQQVLGFPSRRTTKQYTEEMLLASTRPPHFRLPVKWVVMGIDVGKHYHHAVVIECIYQQARSPVETFNSTHYRVLEAREITWDDIPELIAIYNVHKVGIDFKPETYTVAKVAYNIPELLPCEQYAHKGLSPLTLKQDDVSGMEVNIARIDTTYFLDSTYDVIAGKRIEWACPQPDDWLEHFNNIYATADKWMKVGGADHWAYALHFALAAHYNLVCV